MKEKRKLRKKIFAGLLDKNRRTGFTMLESLIAITIIVVAVTGPIGLSATGISSAVYSKNEITAFYLAQEAFETMRKIRDEDALGLNSFTGESSPFYQCIDAKCRVEPMSNNGQFLKSCETESCADLYINSRYDSETGSYLGTGRYAHETSYITAISGESLSDWVKSPYSREVWITELPDDSPNKNRELEVKVEVKWKTGLLDRSVVLRDLITCWSYSTDYETRCGSN